MVSMFMHVLLTMRRKSSSRNDNDDIFLICFTSAECSCSTITAASGGGDRKNVIIKKCRKKEISVPIHDNFSLEIKKPCCVRHSTRNVLIQAGTLTRSADSPE